MCWAAHRCSLHSTALFPSTCCLSWGWLAGKGPGQPPMGSHYYAVCVHGTCLPGLPVHLHASLIQWYRCRLATLYTCCYPGACMCMAIIEHNENSWPGSTSCPDTAQHMSAAIYSDIYYGKARPPAAGVSWPPRAEPPGTARHAAQRRARLAPASTVRCSANHGRAGRCARPQTSQHTHTHTHPSPGAHRRASGSPQPGTRP
jgi:hypothetical protein